MKDDKGKGDKRKERGNRGEDIATDYLTNLGYTILNKNYRCPLGEMDLVVRDGDFIVFVEVRSRWKGGFGSPEQSITKAKKKKLWQLGAYYLQRELGREVLCRFDLLAVNAYGQDTPTINHIKGILS